MQNNSSHRIYGVLGYPARHSLSPLMHNAAFSALKINAEYKIFEKRPDELEGFLLKSVFAENISGFNITIPYKVKAREILEKQFPYNQNNYLVEEDLYYVKLSSAINTVKRNADRLEYRNTDAAGFLASLREVLNFDTRNKEVLLVGCGGAGRAIIAGLSWKSIGIKKIYINDINNQAINSAKEHFLQFQHLKNKLEFIAYTDIPKIIRNCNLLVNASPIGMKAEDATVVAKNLLHRELYVYDIVYNQNLETRLVKDAKSLSLPVADGLDMLLYQGVRAFEFWTGEPAPIEVMRDALKLRSEKS